MIYPSSHFLSFSFPLAFEVAEDPDGKSFFSEIISSVSDIKFINNGDLILSRDYLTLKVFFSPSFPFPFPFPFFLSF